MTKFLRVRILGHDVRVVVRPGREPGTPLVLCNGIGASLDLLQPFVDEVDPRIEVVRFDVPGVGGSPAPRVPYNFAMLARLVGTLVDRLGYDRFDALGVSWGGGLAQQLAFQFPRRCRRLVLVSTGTGMLMVPARLSVLTKMLTPERYRDPAYAEAIAPVLYGGRTSPRPARRVGGNWSRPPARCPSARALTGVQPPAPRRRQRSGFVAATSVHTLFPCRGQSGQLEALFRSRAQTYVTSPNSMSLTIRTSSSSSVQVTSHATGQTISSHWMARWSAPPRVSNADEAAN